MQDTVQLQTTSVKSTAKTSTSNSGSAKKTEQNAASTDPFLQIILSMIGQDNSTNDAADSTDSSGLSDVFGLIQNLGTGSLQTNSGSTGTANVLMSLLGGSSSSFAALQSLGSDSQTGASNELLAQLLQMLTQSTDGTVAGMATGTAADTQTLLQQLAGVTQTGTAANLLQSLPGAANTAGTNLDAATAGALAQLTAAQTVTSTRTGADADESGLLSQQDFSRTIARARELLAKTDADSDTDETETADKLQSTLSAARSATPFELRLQQNAAKTESTSLTQQLTDGLNSNLSLGKSEFTIRLKPESLGEITVKLTEEAGKSVLTITTASAATAKLLNSDLDSLKAAMAPLNVRVNEAVTQTASAQQGSSQQFDMAGQQFAGQQQQQQFARQFAARQNTYYPDRQTADDTLYTASAAATAARTYVSSGLNAYV